MSSYYRPYSSSVDSSDSESASDSGSASDTDTDISTDFLNAAPNFVSLASNLVLSAGPNFVDSSNILSFTKASGAPLIEDQPFPSFSNLTFKPDTNASLLKTETKTVNNIVMLSSADRDSKVFPQPTTLTLRLPREYNNVTNFQIQQIKLLSSFFYFRANKNNLDITIYELGRYINNSPIFVTSKIREGTYTISSLLTELQIQLNTPPIFYDYINGFSDFAQRFASTGDYSLNFNYPGDYYFDSLLNIYIPNPTMALIVSKYFQTQYAGLSSYSTQQLKVAYYYPVVKEILLDNQYSGSELNLTLTTSAQYLLPTETVKSRCVHTFQGLNDPVVQEVIDNNIVVLDQYRVAHTFRQTLINNYVASYEQQSNRIIIYTQKLNTSLVNLLTAEYNELYSQQLQLNGVTAADITNITAQNTILLAILTDIYFFIQRWLAVYFGVQFNSYTIDYIATPTNTIGIRDGRGAINVSSNYDARLVQQNIVPSDSNIVGFERTLPPYYWTSMKNLSNTVIERFPQPLTYWNGRQQSNSFPLFNGLTPYDSLTDTQYYDYNYPQTAVNSNSILYNNKLQHMGEVVIQNSNAQYSVFEFKSSCRQTLQISTSAVPLKYRYLTASNACHSVVTDISYSFIIGSNENKIVGQFQGTFGYFIDTYPGANSNNGGIANTNCYGINYADSYIQWDTGTYNMYRGYGLSQFAQITPQYPKGLWLFAAPPPPETLSGLVYYPMALTFTRYQPTSNINAITMFLYADLAAVIADISDNFNESPINYKQKLSIPANQNTGTLTFTAFSQREYYLIVRSDTQNPFYESYRVVLWFPNNFNNLELSTNSNIDVNADPNTNLSNYYYAAVASPDFIKLPISSNLFYSPPSYDPLYNHLTFSNFPMGFDSNNVSTNFTDYIVTDDFGNFTNILNFNNEVKQALGVDILNLYYMQIYSNDSYKPNTQSYFAPNSKVNIFIFNPTTFNQTNYVPGTLGQRQTSLVYWYDNYFLSNSIYQAPMEGYIGLTLGVNAECTLFDSNTTNSPLKGYTYAGSNSSLQFGLGVTGISLIPDEGVWDLNRFTFNTVYITSNVATDPNLNIKYLGVFPAAYTIGKYGHQIDLSDATIVLKFLRSTTIIFDFDNQLYVRDGTTYEFVKDLTYVTTSKYKVLNGYSQQLSTFNNDIHAAYVVVPFDSNGTLLTYQGLKGSPVPYPFYSDASNGSVYYDGTSNLEYNYATEKYYDIIIPVMKPGYDSNAFFQYYPSPGYDQTQFQYQQSSPVGTTLLQYISAPDTAGNYYQYTDLPMTATTTLLGDVSGYMLALDTSFRVYSYDSSRVFTLRFSFTLDMVFNTANANVVFLGMAANESEYAFFSYSNADISGHPIPAFPPMAPYTSTYADSNARLIIITLNAETGVITEVSQVAPLAFEYLSVQSIKYNNYGGFTIGAAYYDNDVSYNQTFAFCQHQAGDVSGVTKPRHTFIFPSTPQAGPNPTVVVAQSPKENGGVFFGFFYNGDLSTVTKSVPANYNITPNPSYEYQAISYQDASAAFCEIQTYDVMTTSAFYKSEAAYVDYPTAGYLSNIKNPIVSRIGFNDEIFFSVDTDLVTPEHSLGKSYDFRVSANPLFTYDLYLEIFAPSATSNYMVAGANGGKWYSDGALIFGNLNNIIDQPSKISNAWQIFYPVVRAALTQLQKNFTYIPDLSSVGIYPQHVHTNVFVYQDLSSLYLDISSNANGQSWGLESNFLVANTDFRGYAFNSFLLTAQLESNARPYVIAVRNYIPTEQGEVILRTSLPNTHSFGYVTFNDLSNETVKYSNAPNTFNRKYAETLMEFNSNFIFDSNGRVFGSNQVQGYNGSNFSNVTGFGDLYVRFVNLYEQYNSNVVLINTINSNVASNLSNFIAYDLSNVIPPSAQNRQKYTDPLLFSILWQTAIFPLNLYIEQDWGLGYNLGYAKADTPYDTYHRAQSFYRILDDYINLELNQEFDMNHMDTTSKENRALTQDPQGNIKAYHGKLLLANFGSYAQTLVSNPIIFNPPLGRLDKITFTWYNLNGTVVDNSDCDWTMVVQIVEMKAIPTFNAPTLITPP